MKKCDIIKLKANKRGEKSVIFVLRGAMALQETLAKASDHAIAIDRYRKKISNLWNQMDPEWRAVLVEMAQTETGQNSLANMLMDVKFNLVSQDAGHQDLYHRRLTNGDRS